MDWILGGSAEPPRSDQLAISATLLVRQALHFWFGVYSELERQWRLRRERAAYEVERAVRQYHACEPENRLVARELERRWEECLKQQRQLDDEFERWQCSAPVRLSAEDLQAIRSLAEHLPLVWQAATTTPTDRQRVARLLLDRVEVTVDKTSERQEVVLHWAGGQSQTHTLIRTVSRYAQRSDYPKLVQRLRILGRQRLTAATIAERLNTEGFKPPKRVLHFTPAMVLRLMVHLGLTRRAALGGVEGLGPDEYRPSMLARRLGICRDTVQRWRKSGWLNIRKDADGRSIIWADADEIQRLLELHALPRSWANKSRLAELIRPKARPKS